MNGADKTKRQYDSYVTVIKGGDSEEETNFTEDEWSLVWYIIVNAVILKNNGEVPSYLLREDVPTTAEDFSLDHVKFEAIEELLCEKFSDKEQITDEQFEALGDYLEARWPKLDTDHVANLLAFILSRYIHDDLEQAERMLGFVQSCYEHNASGGCEHCADEVH
jgi:hypothetical protein